MKRSAIDMLNNNFGPSVGFAILNYLDLERLEFQIYYLLLGIYLCHIVL